MENSLEAQLFVLCSDRHILECRRCGERIVLLGLEEDWRKEKRTSFEGQCGNSLTLADRADLEALKVKDLLQDSLKEPAD